MELGLGSCPFRDSGFMGRLHAYLYCTHGNVSIQCNRGANRLSERDLGGLWGEVRLSWACGQRVVTLKGGIVCPKDWGLGAMEHAVAEHRVLSRFFEASPAVCT